jgi:hypothetical protein
MKVKVILKKLKVFGKEIFNILTDIAVPLLAILCAIAEVCQLPASVLLALKKAERWCFFACGTRDEVESIMGIIEGVVDEAIEESKEIQ